MQSTKYQPGKLVKWRTREWIVMPSDDKDLLMLKPLGGSDEEITGVFLPLQLPGEEISEAAFAQPAGKDFAGFQSARLLFDAARLSFRNASGPFRCIGKLSFRPRSYQVVPLVMALQQDVVRLMIADDVGVGKTVEALMILRELWERGEIPNKRVAIICPPHLCEQWQQELKDKLDLHAEIIRSSTAAALDRKLPDDRSVFFHIPIQVISIDYLKSDKRKNIFLQDCPDLVIVDEVHTCAKPAGATSASQQQRYHLLHDIAKKKDRHLLLLTATPHSGKDEEFISLLGLLNPDFNNFKFAEIDAARRKKIADYFIQRKRETIARWVKEDTPFPNRVSVELAYPLSSEYDAFYRNVRDYARSISLAGSGEKNKRLRYWAALALLRGVMSSPACGAEMLNNRRTRLLDEEDKESYARQANPNLEGTPEESDSSPLALLDSADLTQNELNQMAGLWQQAQALKDIQNDLKAACAIENLKVWIKEGFNPIVFCRYISTARYIGELLRQHLPSGVDVQVVTSELADEQRREKIKFMAESDRRVLVATDCLSEGINLQELFSAVMHYDLPWNPNRIEQREGRVDRFGQLGVGKNHEVKTLLLWGMDNRIDATVLRILIKKVRDIQRATGVSIALGEENMSVIDAVIREVLLSDDETEGGRQLSLFADDQFTHELNDARIKAENLRDIFAHQKIKPEEIEASLAEVDEAIGDIQSVREFTIAAITHLGGTSIPDGKGFALNLTNLPPHFKSHFPTGKKLKVSFQSPTPPGYRYIGRNHNFTEQLCQFMLNQSFHPRKDYQPVARAAVICTEAVKRSTTLILFRVRNVIKEASSIREVISEEMYLWGYAGSGNDFVTLDYAESKALLLSAVPAANLSMEEQHDSFLQMQNTFKGLEEEFKKVARLRAEKLVEAHGRFKNLVGGKRYEAVHPVLPPDIMGIYLLKPVPEVLF